MEKFLIFSKKHSPHRDLAMWWGPNQCGYTTDIKQAGRYTVEEAAEIVGSGKTSHAVQESALADLLPRTVVDYDEIPREMLNV